MKKRRLGFAIAMVMVMVLVARFHLAPCVAVLPCLSARSGGRGVGGAENPKVGPNFMLPPGQGCCFLPSRLDTRPPHNDSYDITSSSSDPDEMGGRKVRINVGIPST
jgi:hypothetical protein